MREEAGIKIRLGNISNMMTRIITTRVAVIAVAVALNKIVAMIIIMMMATIITRVMIIVDPLLAV